MANIKRFHPGVYIKETLEAMEMTAREFSARTGISERTLSAIINGNEDITFDIAYKLSLYFDNSVNYWTNLQNQYNLYTYEIEKEKELEEEWNLIKGVKKYLLESNYISDEDGKTEIICKCRQVVGVNSLLLLKKEDSFVCLKEQHTKNEADCFFQNFWIALALNEARKKDVNPFSKSLLISSLTEIRNMTIQNPTVFYPKLQKIFDNCGISFVLLPYLSKSNIYGATKWFSKDNVMLAISNRGEKADLFWFTLFHEISHVLMEHRRETLINMKGSEDEEADRMASEMLIPQKEWDKFTSCKIYTKESINEFAKEIGIHPCIVLGRLHKEKKVPYDRFNKIFNLQYQITNNKK
mgnify:FL=1